MNKYYANLRIGPCPDSFPNLDESEFQTFEHIKDIIKFLGLELFKDENAIGGQGACWTVFGLNGFFLCPGLRELFWLVKKLIEATSIHVNRWLVIKRYFDADLTEKDAIWEWLQTVRGGEWEQVYLLLTLKSKVFSFQHFLEHTSDELFLPGLQLGGISIVPDVPGGEHIQVETRDPLFTGAIQREILREEWRRLNARIPEAQKAGTVRTRL